jgi:hypothetical protein
MNCLFSLNQNPKMSASLNEAAMAGNLQEVTMRLNMGEDINQKLYPRHDSHNYDISKQQASNYFTLQAHTWIWSELRLDSITFLES